MRYSYPEHDKLSAPFKGNSGEAKVSDVSYAQGEFVEWLRATHGLVLCRMVHYNYDYSDEFPNDKEYIEVRKDDEHTKCTARCQWYPDMGGETGLNKLLGEYHEIDYDKLQNEKDLMLRELREAHR